MADFTNAAGEVDEVGKQWAFKTYNELQIFKQGVIWGRQTVVSAQEAREIWERVNASE